MHSSRDVPAAVGASPSGAVVPARRARAAGAPGTLRVCPGTAAPAARLQGAGAPRAVLLAPRAALAFAIQWEKRVVEINPGENDLKLSVLENGT